MKNLSQAVSRSQGAGKPEQEYRSHRFAELDRLIAAAKQGPRTSHAKPSNQPKRGPGRPRKSLT